MAHDYLKYSRVVCSFFHLITVCRGVLCRLYCPYEFVRVNGCPICKCKRKPPRKIGELCGGIYGQCSRGLICKSRRCGKRRNPLTPGVH